MSANVIAYRYAKALYDMSEETGVLDVVREDTQQVSKGFAMSKELVHAMENPLLSSDEKEEMVKKIFAGASPLLIQFIQLLSNKHRLSSLEAIGEQFRMIDLERRGVVEAEVTCFKEMDKAQLSQLTDQLGKRFNKTVELSQKVDTSLKGGFKVLLGDKLYDYSLQTQLTNMEFALSKM